ncbi:MAG: low-specificity L-threonine aldolase [Acidobacteriaceae bacterium]|nr:low-specificity L-threonine aldolase [Acidobacteriaceae bacterium]
MIDLRSDTVTRPSEAMRRAMATAEVGDDVYGEDPTINRLEARAAEIFGREAALFLPTGSMGNTIAARLHTEHGQEIICESRAHLIDWEMAMVAAFAGCVPRTVPADQGVLRWESIAKAIAPKIYYKAQTALVWIENTHNMAGGIVTPLEELQRIWAGAKAAGLRTHCDGARIFNAAAALNSDVKSLTSGFDTVMFCLSKGLGAPVGSMLVGSKELMDRARSYRKALGGGMRQAGILAAAGLIALEEMPARIADDHRNARLLAEAVATSPAVRIDVERVQTNIVVFELANGGDAFALVAALKEAGVLVSAIGPHAVRLVTHLDVSDSDCALACEKLVTALKALSS